MCLRVTGPLRAMKCPSSDAHAALQRDLGEDVVAQVAQHSAGVGQLGAVQVDLVVRHHPDKLKDLLSATKLGPSMWYAEGLGLCAGRVLQPRAPLRKVARVQLPHGARAAVQRPERSRGAQRHRGARLHETQRRGFEDPLAGQPGAGRGAHQRSEAGGAFWSRRCSWAACSTLTTP